MKETLNEKLILLATAQERMFHISDMMEQFDNSQVFIEKSAYDSINESDKILNLSKESFHIIEKLQEYISFCYNCEDKENSLKIKTLMKEVQILLQNILAQAIQVNEVSHQIEAEAAYQREIGDKLKGTLCEIGDGIDSAAACAEFLLTEM